MPVIHRKTFEYIESKQMKKQRWTKEQRQKNRQSKKNQRKIKIEGDKVGVRRARESVREIFNLAEKKSLNFEE